MRSKHSLYVKFSQCQCTLFCSTYDFMIKFFGLSCCVTISALYHDQIYFFLEVTLNNSGSFHVQPLSRRSQKLLTKYACWSFIAEEHINYELPNYKVWLMGRRAMRSVKRGVKQLPLLRAGSLLFTRDVCLKERLGINQAQEKSLILCYYSCPNQNFTWIVPKSIDCCCYEGWQMLVPSTVPSLWSLKISSLKVIIVKYRQVKLFTVLWSTRAFEIQILF